MVFVVKIQRAKKGFSEELHRYFKGYVHLKRIQCMSKEFPSKLVKESGVLLRAMQFVPVCYVGYKIVVCHSCLTCFC